MITKSDKTDGVFVGKEYEPRGDIHASFVDLRPQLFDAQAKGCGAGLFVRDDGPYGIIDFVLVFGQ